MPLLLLLLHRDHPDPTGPNNDTCPFAFVPITLHTTSLLTGEPITHKQCTKTGNWDMWTGG